MYNSPLLQKTPKDLHARFLVLSIGLKARHPNITNETIDRLSYKYLHAETLADWMQWKYDNKGLWGYKA